MAQRRKTVTMSVTVTVPAWMNAREARREVRTLINHQSNWLSHHPTTFEEVEVKATAVTPNRSA